MSEHQAEIYIRNLQAFRNRWGPKGGNPPWAADDFERELMQLLCAASRVAVEPFVQELRGARDMRDLQAMVTAKVPDTPAASNVVTLTPKDK